MNVLRIRRGLRVPNQQAAVAAWFCLVVIVRPVEAESPSGAFRDPVVGRVAASGPSSPRAGFANAMGDVALRPGGVLDGQVFCGDDNASDGAVAGLAVGLLRGRQTIAEGTTDLDGRFALRNLSGGVYRIVIDTADARHWRFYRLWTSDGAPPHASSQVNMLVGQRLIRGQSPTATISFPRAAAITAIAAGAIAPPIIYHNVKRDDDIPASP